ncbi:DUF615 domain-containing protein [Alteromonas portus]|uniref:dual-action ribosomal maturation protein DarP n=1 Tax=Alteromonas portus TaxID=2565549 RepID=UPI003BF8725F
MEAHSELDRQKLRQFHRQTKKEREKNAPPKAFRELFQYLKDAMLNDSFSAMNHIAAKRWKPAVVAYLAKYKQEV